MWLSHREIREHGHYSSPATISQTPNDFPATTTHFPLCFIVSATLQKKQQEKTGEEGPFEERDKEGGLRLARCTSAVCEQVLLSVLYV